MVQGLRGEHRQGQGAQGDHRLQPGLQGDLREAEYVVRPCLQISNQSQPSRPSLFRPILPPRRAPTPSLSVPLAPRRRARTARPRTAPSPVARNSLTSCVARRRSSPRMKPPLPLPMRPPWPRRSRSRPLPSRPVSFTHHRLIIADNLQLRLLTLPSLPPRSQLPLLPTMPRPTSRRRPVAPPSSSTTSRL